MNKEIFAGVKSKSWVDILVIGLFRFEYNVEEEQKLFMIYVNQGLAG